jgi:hypothetical protein
MTLSERNLKQLAVILRLIYFASNKFSQILTAGGMLNTRIHAKVISECPGLLLKSFFELRVPRRFDLHPLVFCGPI